MRKVLGGGFIIASMLVMMIFVTAKTYAQLGVAVFLYPLLVYVCYELFIRRTPKIQETGVVSQVAVKPQGEGEERMIETPQKQRIDVVDIDKRAFLKIIGAAGISFFLFSIFNRKTGNLFGGNIRSPEVSTKEKSGVDQIQGEPTDKYRISEIEDNDIAFYGFTNKDGGWFIMREDPDSGSFRYIKGEQDFSSNWANRENLNYDYYHNIF